METDPEAPDVQFDIVDPESDDAVSALHAYFGELAARFSDGFEPGDTLTADAPHFRAPQGAFAVARLGDEVVACGGVQLLSPEIAEIKRMWVSSSVRGQGLGGRTLSYLESVGVDLGATTMRLDTNLALTEAIAMYLGRGYVDIECYNDNPYAGRWFEKPLS